MNTKRLRPICTAKQVDDDGNSPGGWKYFAHGIYNGSCFYGNPAQERILLQNNDYGERVWIHQLKN